MSDIHKRLRIQKQKRKKNEIGRLTVVIHSASDLAPRDSNGLSDPYVIVSFHKVERRTKTFPKNLNPNWSEKFAM